MKLLFILLLLFTVSSQAKKEGRTLELRGEIRESVTVEYSHNGIKVKSNNSQRKISAKRAPASYEGYEQIELTIP